MQLLSESQEKLLFDERSLLHDLRVALARLGAAPEDQTTLEESIRQLEQFFLIVVVGEFNAGKSAFINALLGKNLLKEGVTPTTTQINVLQYGPEETRVPEGQHLHLLTAPVELLKNLSIVDTPGTNAIIREHEAITTQFVPRADLVLFVTSADRPFSESERAFMEKIRDWGKKVVLVINKLDILEKESELEEIVGFIAENAHGLLGIRPEIFPVSARQALRAKQGEPHLWQKSRFEPLETYIASTLDQGGRIRLKLLNPLGVGEHLIQRYTTITRQRLDLLKDDFEKMENIERQLDIYKTDMQRDFEFRMADIEKLLYQMEQRGDEYFDETIRLARVADLMKKEKIQKEFEQKVVADVPQRIESRVAEMIDWLVEADLRQWHAVSEHVAERRQAYKDKLIGDMGVGTFHYDRERLIDSVGQESRRVVEGYDKTNEARQLAEGVQNAVAAVAVLEVGAVGLGVLVTTIATTMAVDVTGILMASFIALVGLFVIPARRRVARQEMHTKIAEMRARLVGALRTQFEREIQNSIQHINDAIAPYTRFVRAEREKFSSASETLAKFNLDLNRIRTRVEDLNKG